ncbi:hypothetical protein HS088_TW20G00410 [Tripterygium wilfordii]|uniref:Reticulon-like protein n=1 Tax=Tripterygium wilfordii TaxID=458696 RepID=A0A7J7C7F7_TRIWF|nr:hypothetical protein HS088_TW20G00410 [Tripterygium wilfordii]
MADEVTQEESAGESLMDKISEKIDDHDSSSSSDSDHDEKSSPSSIKSKISRLFGREKPVHKVLGGGKVLFLWSNASTFINKSAPRIPEVHIPEDPVLQIASALRIEINRSFALLRNIASGRDLKNFLYVIAGLWVLSIVGSWCNFLTLFYIAFVLLHTVPVLYDKYEDQVDSFAEKAMAEIKKQYAVFDAKVLSKIPRRPLKDKKKV